MRQCVYSLSAVLMGIVLLSSTGCDFLKGSGTGVRVSPLINALIISPSTMLCDQQFTVSFDYDDPQGDISQMTVNFQQAGTATSRDVKVDWKDSSTLNLKTGGHAIYTTKFSCTDPGGTWTIKVMLEDSKGHLSNSLSHDVALISAG